MDADKTLAAEDTGSLFWDEFKESNLWVDTQSPLATLFGGPLGYSENAFRQATLLYEEVANDEVYERICEQAASLVNMYPDFLSLLHSIADHDHVGAIVVTCGPGRVWEKVLERQGLSNIVKVIGGGRISDNFVITAADKAAVVATLKEDDGLTVWGFGDSPLDLPMLKEADKAIVVVGDQQSRSRSMDVALSGCIHHEGLKARQVLQPDDTTPRLNGYVLPIVRLDDEDLLRSIVRRRDDPDDEDIARNCGTSGTWLLHATDRNAAKILMSPTRDASIAGPMLREKHQSIGRYLAIEYLADILGVEEYSIPHVQGHLATGYRFFNESQISIVALMRGGEPMAFGINDAMPTAMFIHATSILDVRLRHLQNQRAVILVDSVINSGATVAEFLQRVRFLHARIQIIVVAGVVQAEVASRDHALAKEVAHVGAKLVALRLSENKYTGSKATDTGNRLFNTIHLS